MKASITTKDRRVRIPAFPALLFVLLVICVLILGMHLYHRQSARIRLDAENNLDAVALLKLRQIQQWRNERTGNALSIAQNPFLITRIQKFVESSSAADLGEDLRGYFENLIENYRYSEIHLLSPDGHIRVTTGTDSQRLGPEELADFRQAILKKTVHMTDIQIDSRTDEPFLDLYAPICSMDSSGQSSSTVVACLIFAINPEIFLFPLIQTSLYPTETGETILIRKEGNDVVYLNRLRGRPESSLFYRLPIQGHEDLPAVKAVQGFEGITYGIDYRQVRVLSSVHHIENSPWFLLTKIDESEVMAPVRNLVWLVFGSVVGLVVLMGASVLFWWKRKAAESLQRELNAEREQRTSEVMANEANRLVATVLNSVSDGFMALNQDFVVVYFNPSAAKLLGRTSEEVLGRKLFDSFPEARGSVFEEKYTWALKEQQFVAFETYFDSPPFDNWYDVRVYPYGGGISVFFQVTTDRRKAEEKLRASEQRFRDLFEHMAEGMALHELTYDSSGMPDNYRILNVNPAFEKMLGIPAARAIGAVATELYGTESPPFMDTYKKVATTGIPCQFDVDFQPLHKHFSISVFSPEQGLFATIFEDITGRAQFESERAQLIKQLQEKNRELEDVVYAASHDLRTPLVNIVGFTQVLERTCKDLTNRLAHVEPSKDQDMTTEQLLIQRLNEPLQFIQSSTMKMDALIGGLLKLSRLGRVAVQIEQLDMNEILAHVVQSDAYMIKNVECDLTIEPLPSCKGDSLQVNQIFSNLIDNSLKYLSPDRPLVMRVYGVVRENESVYCVEDNGIGIPVDRLETIWRVFYRVDERSGIPGEGLGLALIRRMIERNHGRGWVESEHGKGSRFYVALPR